MSHVNALKRDLGLGVAQRFSWMSITRDHAKATGDRVGSDEPLTVHAVQREQTFADLLASPWGRDSHCFPIRSVGRRPRMAELESEGFERGRGAWLWWLSAAR